jgi:hypothetical protein
MMNTWYTKPVNESDAPMLLRITCYRLELFVARGRQ